MGCPLPSPPPVLNAWFAPREFWSMPTMNLADLFLGAPQAPGPNIDLSQSRLIFFGQGIECHGAQCMSCKFA